MLCGCGRAFVFVDLEARNHLIDNGVGVVEAKFIDGASCFSDFKVSFAEVVLEFETRLVCVVCTFSCSDVSWVTKISRKGIIEVVINRPVIVLSR